MDMEAECFIYADIFFDMVSLALSPLFVFQQYDKA